MLHPLAVEPSKLSSLAKDVAKMTCFVNVREATFTVNPMIKKKQAICLPNLCYERKQLSNMSLKNKKPIQEGRSAN